MFRSLNRFVRLAMIVTLPLALLAPAHAAPQGKVPMANVEKVDMGSRFPPHTFDNLNAGVAGPERIDFAKVYGKKAIVLCYWILRNKRAESDRYRRHISRYELQEYLPIL